MCIIIILYIKYYNTIHTYNYINTYNLTACVAQWLRRQTHKQ